MKTKILLILPPRTCKIQLELEIAGPPLGLAYLASFLEKNKYSVKIIDAIAEGLGNREKEGGLFRVGLSDQEISKRIREYNPDIVGINCSFSAFKDDSLRIAELVKKINPKIVVVFGGAHTSANPVQVAKEKNVDIAVFGEGELTFLEIAECIEKHKGFSGIKGTVVKKNGRIKKNPPRGLIKNLDELPFPARHLLPMDIYFKLQKSKIYPFSMRYPIVELISSRGCPGNCVFCSINSVWGRCWRARSAKNVVDEIEYCVKKFGAREFFFMDDNISLSKKRLIEICQEIVHRKLDIKWQTPNGIAIWTLDREVLQWMKKSGYYRAKFGLETGSVKMQEYIRKKINLEQAKKIIIECNKLGIWTASSFIIGFPNEKPEDVQETINFAKSTHLDFARFLIAQPYAGTELFNEFAKHGLIKKDELLLSSVFNSSYNVLHFTSAQLNKTRKNAQKEFLISRLKLMVNPYYFCFEFLPKIWSWEFFVHFLKNGLEILKGNFQIS